MKQNIVEKKKVFGAQTEFTLDHSSPEALAASKQNRHFHQRMLRAYLKGKSEFNFGTNALGNPISHPVLIKFV